MNRFDHYFFTKYVPSDEHITSVHHRHVISIIDDILLWGFFGVFLPSLFYTHNSFFLRDFIDFIWFESWLWCVWGIIMWRIFDWYNDVWIITNKTLIDLDWSPIKQSYVSVEFHTIRNVEVQENTIFDNLLNRGDVVAHCLGTSVTLSGAWKPEKVMDDLRSAGDSPHVEETPSENHTPHDEHTITRESEFELLVEALKDLVRERIDEKRVRQQEQASFRPVLRETLQKKGTIDLRPDHEKWEHEEPSPAKKFVLSPRSTPAQPLTTTPEAFAEHHKEDRPPADDRQEELAEYPEEDLEHASDDEHDHRDHPHSSH